MCVVWKWFLFLSGLIYCHIVHLLGRFPSVATYYWWTNSDIGVNLPGDPQHVDRFSANTTTCWLTGIYIHGYFIVHNDLGVTVCANKKGRGSPQKGMLRRLIVSLFFETSAAPWLWHRPHWLSKPLCPRILKRICPMHSQSPSCLMGVAAFLLAGQNPATTIYRNESSGIHLRGWKPHEKRNGYKPPH